MDNYRYLYNDKSRFSKTARDGLPFNFMKSIVSTPPKTKLDSYENRNLIRQGNNMPDNPLTVRSMRTGAFINQLPTRLERLTPTRAVYPAEYKTYDKLNINYNSSYRHENRSADNNNKCVKFCRDFKNPTRVYTNACHNGVPCDGNEKEDASRDEQQMEVGGLDIGTFGTGSVSTAPNLMENALFHDSKCSRDKAYDMLLPRNTQTEMTGIKVFKNGWIFRAFIEPLSKLFYINTTMPMIETFKRQYAIENSSTPIKQGQIVATNRDMTLFTVRLLMAATHLAARQCARDYPRQLWHPFLFPLVFQNLERVLSYGYISPAYPPAPLRYIELENKKALIKQNDQSVLFVDETAFPRSFPKGTSFLKMTQQGLQCNVFKRVLYGIQLTWNDVQSLLPVPKLDISINVMEVLVQSFLRFRNGQLDHTHDTTTRRFLYLDIKEIIKRYRQHSPQTSDRADQIAKDLKESFEKTCNQERDLYVHILEYTDMITRTDFHVFVIINPKDGTIKAHSPKLGQQTTTIYEFYPVRKTKGRSNLPTELDYIKRFLITHFATSSRNVWHVDHHMTPLDLPTLQNTDYNRLAMVIWVDALSQKPSIPWFYRKQEIYEDIEDLDSPQETDALKRLNGMIVRYCRFIGNDYLGQVPEELMAQMFARDVNFEIYESYFRLRFWEVLRFMHGDV